jgi:linoleate 10R-lipoxygenase
LPLKTKENPRGVFTEHELYTAISVTFMLIFFDIEPTKSFPLRTAARKLALILGKLMTLHVDTVIATSFAGSLVDHFRENDNALRDYGIHMIRRLTETGMKVPEIVYSHILPTAGGMVPTQGQVFSQIMDFYLQDKNKAHLADIQRVSRGPDTVDADAKLLHYAMEGIRISGQFGSFRRSEVTHTFNTEPSPVTVKPGDRVFCSFIGAGSDPRVFPEPDQVKLDRDIDSYIHFGTGDHTCLGKEASMVALTAMLRIVGRMEGLRRADGPQGQLKTVTKPGGLHGESDFSFCGPYLEGTDARQCICEKITVGTLCSRLR